MSKQNIISINKQNITRINHCNNTSIMFAIASEYKQRSIAFMNTLSEDTNIQMIIIAIFSILIATVIACSLWVYYQSKNNQNNINNNNDNKKNNMDNSIKTTKPSKSTRNKPVVTSSSSSELSATSSITLKDDNNQTKQCLLQQQQKQTSVPTKNTNIQHNTSNLNNNITIKEQIPTDWNYNGFNTTNRSNYKSEPVSSTQQANNNNNDNNNFLSVVKIGDMSTITKQRTIETTITYENKPITFKQTITDKINIPTNLFWSPLSNNDNDKNRKFAINNVFFGYILPQMDRFWWLNVTDC